MHFSKRLARRRRYDELTISQRQLLIRSSGQNKEDASELVSQKADLETQKKAAEDAAAQKELERDRKIRAIGNYVHESVPVSNNEVMERRNNSSRW